MKNLKDFLLLINQINQYLAHELNRRGFIRLLRFHRYGTNSTCSLHQIQPLGKPQQQPEQQQHSDEQSFHALHKFRTRGRCRTRVELNYSFLSPLCLCFIASSLFPCLSVSKSQYQRFVSTRTASSASSRCSHKAMPPLPTPPPSL